MDLGGVCVTSPRGQVQFDALPKGAPNGFSGGADRGNPDLPELLARQGFAGGIFESSSRVILVFNLQCIQDKHVIYIVFWTAASLPLNTATVTELGLTHTSGDIKLFFMVSRELNGTTHFMRLHPALRSMILLQLKQDFQPFWAAASISCPNAGSLGQSPSCAPDLQTVQVTLLHLGQAALLTSIKLSGRRNSPQSTAEQ